MRMKRAIGFGLASLVLLTILGAANVSGPSGQPLPAGAKADRILVEKSAHRLTLLRGGRPLKVYLVALGRGPIGDKVQQGDNRTPEGVFVIDGRNSQSAYHRALHVSYPDAAHRARAKKLGVSPGGDIMIHGLPNNLSWLGALHRRVDWTAGCIALTDPEIEEVWHAVPNGTPVEIRP